MRQNQGEYAEQTLTLPSTGELRSGAVIRMAGKNGRRAIELLGEHDAGKPVRQSERPERQLQIGAGEHLRRQPLGAADEKGEARGAAVAKSADGVRELGAAELIALAVEAHQFMGGRHLAE